MTRNEIRSMIKSKNDEIKSLNDEISLLKIEEYYDELLAYRNEIEAEEKKEWNAKLLQRSIELGVEGNIKLAEYIEYLKCRIEKLEEMIVSLK